MQIIRYQRWTLQCDVEATRSAYLDLKADSETCSCCMCRNFILARNQFYPKEVLDLFEQLGIDSWKELCNSSVCLGDGMLYMTEHCFIGRAEPDEQLAKSLAVSKRLVELSDQVSSLPEGPARQELLKEQADLLAAGLQGVRDEGLVSFTGRNITPTKFPEPAVSIGYEGRMPWLLNEPQPDR